MDNLPLVEVGGRKFHSTLQALHTVTTQRHPIDFESFGQMLQAVDSELRSTNHSRGLELPTIRRFAELARRLGIDDSTLAEVFALPGHAYEPENRKDVDDSRDHDRWSQPGDRQRAGLVVRELLGRRR